MSTKYELMAAGKGGNDKGVEFESSTDSEDSRTLFVLPPSARGSATSLGKESGKGWGGGRGGTIIKTPAPQRKKVSLQQDSDTYHHQFHVEKKWLGIDVQSIQVHITTVCTCITLLCLAALMIYTGYLHGQLQRVSTILDQLQNDSHMPGDARLQLHNNSTSQALADIALLMHASSREIVRLKQDLTGVKQSILNFTFVMNNAIQNMTGSESDLALLLADARVVIRKLKASRLNERLKDVEKHLQFVNNNDNITSSFDALL